MGKLIIFLNYVAQIIFIRIAAASHSNFGIIKHYQYDNALKLIKQHVFIFSHLKAGSKMCLVFRLGAK